MNVKELLQDKKLLAVIAALLVVVILFCLVVGGNKAEKTVNNYIKYMQKEKAEKLYKTLPKDIRNYLKDEDYEEDTIEVFEDMCEAFSDYVDDAKFKILDVEKMSEDDLEEYEDHFEEIADEIDEKLKVQAGRYVIVKTTDEDGNVDASVIDVIKVDGAWFVADLVGGVVMD